jgi:hypothetical protein
MAENNFKIAIAPKRSPPGFIVVLEVDGLEDKSQAEAFAESLAQWLTAEGGWKQRVQ